MADLTKVTQAATARVQVVLDALHQGRAAPNANLDVSEVLGAAFSALVAEIHVLKREVDALRQRP